MLFTNGIEEFRFELKNNFLISEEKSEYGKATLDKKLTLGSLLTEKMVSASISFSKD